MQQRERSERSRAQILEAALRLFSHQGYRGTSIREIAQAAGISTGNLYHQFPDKESLFRTLLDHYFEAMASPEFPFNRALAGGAFPSDLDALAEAARDSVARYRGYVALIYVGNLRVSPQRVSGDLVCLLVSNLSCTAHFSAPLFTDRLHLIRIGAIR